MNLSRLLTGCMRVLMGAPNWEEYFDFSRRGFYQSFGAVILSLPFYGLCAQMVLRERALNTDAAPYLPIGTFTITALLHALTFILVCYIVTLVFARQARFKPWVIIRQWTLFFLVLLAGLIAGISLIGVLPFSAAIYGLLILYLSTLAIDIRIAKIIGGFDWVPAIFTGCLITAMGLMVLLIAAAQSI